ncbi:hypothetical protein [Halocatena pleomorpha]|uniref:Uncharacterized protein n=1 Tax=Halocatena pleomorpha TaxID=1785090 RepID=A0A3P3R2W1_9EURY|nr:hypothetical protein [Halocatena pleomorpha]RRJ27812.1 hypothetical protein EIK79_17165 [Halocatena pleomorpha]
MSGAGYNEKVQFRAGAEKAAAETLDEMRLGGINVSELARQGLREMLRRTLSEEDKIRIHRRYAADEIDEDVARVLLGDAIEEIDREQAAFEAAMELDTDDVVQD